MRTLSPQCDLDPAWEDEDLVSAINRAITSFHKMTVKTRRKTFNQDQGKTYLSAPAFCYCFPIIHSALLSSVGRNDETLITTGLQIISEHAQMRGQFVTLNNNSIDLFHPSLLPRKQMLELLIEIISKHH